MAKINIISTMQNDCIYLGKDETEVLLKGRGILGIIAQNIVDAEHLPYLMKDECYARATSHGLYRVEKKELTGTELGSLDLSGFEDPSRRITGVLNSREEMELSQNEQPNPKQLIKTTNKTTSIPKVASSE